MVEETAFCPVETVDLIVAIGATTYLLELELSGATNAGGLSKEVAEEPLEVKAESTDFCLFINSKSRYSCISSSNVLRENIKL